MGLHSREEQRSFTHAGGEECFVYARDRRQPDVPYFLDDVPVTSEVRDITREFLECPVPVCTSPRLKVVNRTAKRNGFSHLPGAGGHAVESLWHTQAKLMLVHWVHSSYPHCQVAVEAPISDRERVADVLVTFPGGQRVALEVQYSTEDHWQERHASYQRHGITDVWLLGHRPPHLILDRDGHVALSALPSQIVRAGLPLLWVNPDGRIRTGHHTIRGFAVPPDPTEHLPLDLGIDPLERCALSPSGLITPTMEALPSGQSALEALRAREAAARARAEARAKATAAQRAKDAETRDQRAECAEKMRARRHEAWQGHPLRKELLDTYGKVPEPLTVAAKPNGGVFADPEHWHAVVHADLIHGRIGTHFTVGDIYRSLTNSGIGLHRDARKRSATVGAYLRELDSRGLIAINRLPDDSGWITDCTVLLDLPTYVSKLAEEQRRRQQEERDRQRTEHGLRLAVEAQKQAEAAARAQWDYPLDVEWDGNVNLVQHYVPGTDPVLRWHEQVLNAILHNHVAPTPEAIRRHLAARIAEVPGAALHLFLTTYTTHSADRDSRARKLISPPDIARPVGGSPDPLRLF